MTSKGIVSWLIVVLLVTLLGAQACSGGKGIGVGADADAPLGGAIAHDGGGGIDPGGGVSGTAGVTGAGGLTAAAGDTGTGAGTACGAPGTPCCASNGCQGGGCCVSGICMTPGGACSGLGGGLCSNGVCGTCGGPGLACCHSGLGPVCTSAGTTCSGGICAKCGEQGIACCASAAGVGTCNGANLLCSTGLCQKCGVPGGPCCAGNVCPTGCCYGGSCLGEATSCGAGNGTCSAGRCTGCGGTAQSCCGGLCYDALACMGNLCASCGGPGETCCPTGGTRCRAGLACSGTGATAVCARCGMLGDACCPGDSCSDGCCSAGRCIAGSCPIFTGGSTGAGGVTGAGGTLATGGTTRTGGTIGGSTMVTGGTVITGGATATAGSSSTAKPGGTATFGGTIGGATGGMSGTGGTSTSGSTAPQGCGSANTTSPCGKAGSKCSIEVNGSPRTYYLQLPVGYSSSKPYPVVFQYHSLGGTAEATLTLYGINKTFPEAIYVTPQGLESDGNAAWNNTGGRDANFTKAMLAEIESKYCVDTARVFATGFSMGAMMTYDIACELGDLFRAVAPISGTLMSDTASKCATGRPIALWASHGLNDYVLPISADRQARDAITKRNQCGSTTMAVDPSPCVKYQGCLAGYDVTWCEWNGEHAIPSFAAGAIGNFFKQL